MMAYEASRHPTERDLFNTREHVIHFATWHRRPSWAFYVRSSRCFLLARKVEMSKEETVHKHDHNEAVIKRLARIEGHVRGIKRMVEEDTACPDVLVQIAAVRSALNNVGQIILEDHLSNCMVRAVEDDDFEDAMKDLKISLDRFI